MRTEILTSLQGREVSLYRQMTRAAVAQKRLMMLSENDSFV
uniref:Uncharacterized protein n=1 Tax=Anguilla anguilla TaxID=7936 RepID=A0A0E9PN90_ANGAN